MAIQEKFDNRYGMGANNRAFFIADAFIYLGSYSGKEIETAASTLTDTEVAAFHKVIATLINNRKATSALPSTMVTDGALR